jgi:hypothetical protein
MLSEGAREEGATPDIIRRAAPARALDDVLG